MLLHKSKNDWESKIEWLFLQGYFDGRPEGRTHFMTSFFRIEPDTKKKQAGHALIMALVSSDGMARYDFSSKIDSDAVSIFLKSQKTVPVNIDNNLIDAYCEEVNNYGPPEPIEQDNNTPIFDLKNNSVDWSEFHLGQSSSSSRLECTLPGLGISSFTLTPQRPSFRFDEERKVGTGKTTFYTCPRLELHGSAGDVQVNGRVWLDQQWTNYGYFFNPDGKDGVYGWDWLGINLDDGRDIIVFVYRSMANQSAVARSCYIMSADGSCKSTNTFSFEIVSYWQSPRTHIVYPASINLEIPEINLKLHVEPIAQDQEIPFLGLIRAIWEGAGEGTGTVKGKGTGTVKGIPVSADVRMEFHGYGYIFNTKSYLAGFSEDIDKRIEEFLPRKLTNEWLCKTIGDPHWSHDPEGCTESIAKPVWDLLDRNGKHWRPICTTLFLESLGVESKPYEHLIAAASELNHTGSLIVDDIEDNSLIRRGEECIHLRYGVDTAINAGNSLYFLPYLLLQDHPGLNDQQRLQSYEVMVRMLSKCHIGQGLDIHWSKKLTYENLNTWLEDDFDRKILQMYAYKTGAQVEGVAEMSCIIAKATEEIKEMYKSLGRIFGVTFQIIDDIHNFSNSSGWTKAQGEDIVSGKPTYVIIRAINMLTMAERNRFLMIFCSEEMRNEKKYLQEAVELVINSGALRYCYEEAASMLKTQWLEFAKVARHNDAKIMLKMFLFSILNYSYDV